MTTRPVLFATYRRPRSPIRYPNGTGLPVPIPGSVRTQFSNGKPQTDCYAALRLYCAIIHYCATIHGEATSRLGADLDRYSFTIVGLHFADLTGPPLS